MPIQTRDDILQYNELEEQIQSLRNQHGFFTPFKNGCDFVTTLCDPVTQPVSLALASVIFAAGSVLTASLTLLCLPVAAVAEVCDLDAGGAYLSVSLALAGATLALAGVSLLTAGFAVLSVPETLAKLATRTLTTIAEPFITCCTNSSSEPSMV